MTKRSDSQTPQSTPYELLRKTMVNSGGGLIASPGVNFFDYSKTLKQMHPDRGLFAMLRANIQQRGIMSLFTGLQYTAPIEVCKNLYRPFLAKGTGDPKDIAVAAVVDTAAQLVSEKMKTEAYTSGKVPNILTILNDPMRRSCLVSGWAPLLVRQSIFFASIDQATKLNDWMSQYIHPSIAVPASSAVAGIISTIVATPADVAKTKQQGYNADKRFFPVILTDIVAKEGPGAMFRGLVPRIGSNIFSIGVVVASKKIYDWWTDDSTPSYSSSRVTENPSLFPCSPLEKRQQHGKHEEDSHPVKAQDNISHHPSSDGNAPPKPFVGRVCPPSARVIEGQQDSPKDKANVQKTRKDTVKSIVESGPTPIKEQTDAKESSRDASR